MRRRMIVAQVVIGVALAVLAGCGDSGDSGPPAPGAFDLLSPTDAATTVSLTPVLDWESSLGADAYTLQVGDDPALSSPLIDEAALTASEYTIVAPLAAGVTYYWRVTAINSVGSRSASNNTFSFTTIDTPGAFSLLTPANSAIKVPPTPVLDWGDSSDATTYTLLVDDDPAFGNPEVNDATLTENVYTVASPLAADTIYYWRVTAVNVLGSTAAGNNDFSFTTLPAPGAFDLLSPAHTTTTASHTPAFDWQDSSDAATYTLQVADNPAFASPVIDDATLAESAYTVASPLAADTVYYWRVTAVNASGNAAAGNNPFSFTTPPSADLADLEVSVGVLSPVFSPDETLYSVQGLLPSSITVTPTADDSGATIRVDGDIVVTGTPSLPIGLSMGLYTIEILVTATDGVTEKTYTISTYRGEPEGQQAYLKASNTDMGDQYGYSIAIDGDTAVVGAWHEDSDASGVNGDDSNNGRDMSGAAYVYVRDGATWAQQAYLKASNPGVADVFGYAVAIHGDTIVVGAYLESSSSSGVNGNQSDDSEYGSGAAYVFVRSGTTWTQEAYLKASNPEEEDFFGCAVAVNNDTVAVGAICEDSSATGIDGSGADNSAISSGAAYVFFRSGTTWTQQAYLKASNTEEFDEFGKSVAVDGDTVVVGAHQEGSSSTGVNGDELNNAAQISGAAYVFVRSGAIWTQQAYLKASNTGGLDRFGHSVSIDGDTVVVGAYGEDSNSTGVNGDEADNGAGSSGAAYVFVRSGAVWSQEAYLKASNTDAGDRLGFSIAVSGDNVVAGAHYESSNATGVNGNEDDNSASMSGAAYVFVRNGTTWTQEAYLKPSNTDVNDYFGWTVDICGGTVVVGDWHEDSAATGVDGNDADDSASMSGAAYVFK